MTVGELKSHLNGMKDEDEVEVYVAYEITRYKGVKEKGYFLKDIIHASRLVEGTLILTTSSVTNACYIDEQKENPHVVHFNN